MRVTVGPLKYSYDGGSDRSIFCRNFFNPYLSTLSTLPTLHTTKPLNQFHFSTLMLHFLSFFRQRFSRFVRLITYKVKCVNRKRFEAFLSPQSYWFKSMYFFFVDWNCPSKDTVPEWQLKQISNNEKCVTCYLYVDIRVCQICVGMYICVNIIPMNYNIMCTIMIITLFDNSYHFGIQILYIHDISCKQFLLTPGF